jgi:transporter family protein
MSWDVYAVLTIVLWGAVPLIDKVALRTVAADTGLCLRAFTAGIMLLIYAVWKGKFAEIAQADTRAILCFVVSAVLASVVAQYTYFAALQRAEASRLVPFTASYPLVAAILAVLILHEPFTVTKFAGAALIVGGLVLLGIK